MKVFLGILVVLVGCSSSADSKTTAASPGALLFKQRCALCHASTSQNGQGPGLAGVVGRAAASQPGFHYTKALRDSGLTWDVQTLDMFLASPYTMVKGTMMSVATPDADERKQIIAYLQSLGGAPKAELAPEPQEPASGRGAAPTAPATKSFARR